MYTLHRKHPNFLVMPRTKPSIMSVIRYVFIDYGSDEKIESHRESDNLWEQKPHNRIERKEIAVIIC